VSNSQEVTFYSLLDKARTVLDRGLTEGEVRDAEEIYEIGFSSEHRELLKTRLPIGPGWPDWRHGERETLRRWIRTPIDGILADVGDGDFWWRHWGERPIDSDEAVAVARERFDSLPQLIPLWSHKFVPSLRRDLIEYPVFSVGSGYDIQFFARSVKHFFNVAFAGDPIEETNYRTRMRLGEWKWPASILARSTEVRLIFSDLERYLVPFWSDLSLDGRKA
jgi:hypothetical protein